jgi:hypothetical protein
MARSHPTRRRLGPVLASLGWTLIAGAFVLGVLGAAGPFVFLLPVASLAGMSLALATRRLPRLEEALVGIGAALLFVAFRNRDSYYGECPPGPVVIGPDEALFECGGLDPRPWLVLGIACALAAVLVLALRRSAPLLRRRRRSS